LSEANFVSSAKVVYLALKFKKMEMAQTLLLQKQDYVAEYELDRGKPMPSKNHAKLEHRLSIAFAKYAQYDTFIELSLELKTGKATPDVCLFESEESDWLNDEIRVTQPPLLSIEILSPTQGIDELKDKIYDIFFPSGVQSCWIVVPTLKMIAVFLPNREVRNYIGGIVKDPVLGVEVDIKELFR
jgi:Uma2 family endonuclease